MGTTFALFLISFANSNSNKNKNMDNTKRMSLGVQKNKTTKPAKQSTKKSLNNVLHYLKSDSYMFAPLISLPLSGVKMKQPIKGNKKRLALKKVGTYMKSNNFMYAPLVSSKLVDSLPSGQFLSIRKVAVETSTTTLSLKENGKTKGTESANVTAEKQPRKNSCPGRSNSGNQTSGRGERVKHMVYQHCRSTSLSGKGMPDLQLRKLIVE